MLKNVLNDVEYNYLKKISGSDTWISAALVGGGWSSDVKFKVVDTTGEEYLLRISHIKFLEKKKTEYKAIQKASSLNILMSKPYEFGVIEGEDMLYMKLSWIDGDNVEDAMPKLTKQQQYETGLKAGKLLRKLHTLPTNLTSQEWKQKNIKTLTDRIALYKAHEGYKIEHFEEMIQFIERNMNLLDNRPLTFHHGDFQGRNIIITPNLEVGVIDFERTSGGDPYEEFNRMMTYTRRFSEDFSRGQIDGYFEDEKIPDNFFLIVAFHTAMKLLTTIIFGVITDQKHIYEENELAKEILFNDYKGYTQFIPDWYLKSNYKSIKKNQL